MAHAVYTSKKEARFFYLKKLRTITYHPYTRLLCAVVLREKILAIGEKVGKKTAAICNLVKGD